MKYVIKDWTNRVLFDGELFDTFEDAWGAIRQWHDDAGIKVTECEFGKPDKYGYRDCNCFDDYYVEEEI